jgi:hypothetical protein
MNSKSGTQLAHWTGHIPSKIAVRVVYSGLFAILFSGHCVVQPETGL